MDEKVFVGIDLGTTGIKVVFMDTEGELIASDSLEYSISNPKPEQAEQNPSDWWKALKTITGSIIRGTPNLKSRIACVGIAGQMHTHVYLDKNNNILRNAITWMDQRSQDIVERVNSIQGNKDLIFEKTGNFLTTTYSAPNIMWIKQEEPQVYNKTEKILLAKDYVKFKLTGEMSTDYSDAIGTLLFDTQKKNWTPELFDLFNLNITMMPEVGKSKEIMGEITSQAAEATGLPAGTPVINGSADHAATALGAGVVSPGDVAAILGTAGVVSVVSDVPVGDPEERIFCWNYCLEDKWVNLAPMQTAGASLNWFKKAFDPKDEDVFKIYDKESSNISAGSEGLIFLPYLMGERAPIWDSDARGVFFGVRMDHTKYHFAKAVMEGVGFAFKQNIEVMESLDTNVEEMKFLGGGSKSEEWIEIMSKILGKKIYPVRGAETGGLGISILCGLGLGIYNSPEDAAEILTQKGREYYVSEIPEAYKINYEKFKKLYKNIRNLY